MSVRSWTKMAFRGMLVVVLAICLQSVSLANNLFGPGHYEGPRMATFDSASGETTFALSLSPKVDIEQRASDIVIYVDTSASQTGVFKNDSIATLEQLLASLNADDRVKLVAMDIEPVVLTNDFVGPDSSEISVAIENLKQRVSLGSTDVNLMLTTAPDHFSVTRDRNKNVVYIGDGVTRGELLKTQKFEETVDNLVRNQVSVSSYAIGPERDIELMAALANHTGGNYFVDSDDELAMRTGAIGLAQTVHGSVFWPADAKLPAQIAEAFPKTIPPMRTDRDVILIGTLKERATLDFVVEGQINGQVQTLNWSVAAEESQDDFSFLPQLIQNARANGGMSLPTAGSEGLREAARVIMAQSRKLSELGGHALASGNVDAAKQLASAALKTDPTNTEAGLISEVTRYKIQDDNPFAPKNPAAAEPAPAEPPTAEPPMAEPVAQEPPMTDDGTTPIPAPEEDLTAPPTPATEIPFNQNQPGQPQIVDTPDSFRAVDPGFSQNQIDDLLRQGETAGAQNMILTEEQRIKVMTEKITAQVQFELTRAREELAIAPERAIERIKNMLEILDQTTAIDPNRKQDLRNRLVSGLMSSRQRKLEFDDAEALRNQNMAAAAEHQRSIRDYERQQEEIAQLINRFQSLMDEGRFDEARAVTYEALTIDPRLPAAVVADESSRVERAYVQQYELRRLRQLNFLATLYETEKSAVAFPGNPPLVFPPAAEWARKVALREKYKDVRLAGNDKDEEILRALDEPAFFDFEETEFVDVMDTLRDKYSINVVLDSTAKDDALQEDTPITFKINGIRLKNALRLMLKDHNATFIVRNEVLRIISLDVASDPEYFVTNVFNVGDLVAPRNNPGGGFGGGGGGFGGGGGGLGGGGGGFGGGGGGFGGGGGGRGGGIFCIDDSLDGKTTAQTTTDVASPEVSSRRQSPRILSVEVQPGQTQLEAWSSYFAKNYPAPRDVRTTIRRLMEQRDSAQVVALIQGAMKNNQTEYWMYEALVLAMQIADYPQAEIERAMMSTVDLAGNLDDVLIAANYMANHGMEKRAVRLLEDVADPTAVDPEPFVIGLEAAQRINDVEGIQWATLGILSKAWPKHREIVKKAIYAAESVRKQLASEGRTDELKRYNNQLDEALYRDCIIKVSWTGDADVDIYVEEPGGTVCSRQTPRTTAGGILMGDDYAAYNQKGEMAEYYVLPRGFSGDYRLLIRKVWGDVTAGKVSVAIYNHFRTDKEVSQQKMLEVDEKGTLVLFELKDGRLREALDEHKIQTIADEMFVMDRRALAQQLADGYSPSAASEYYQSEAQAPLTEGQPVTRRNSNLLRPGAVGYRPEITQLFEGSFMFVNHATTSDRLYVMVSASPSFTQITRVDTFNIFGSAQNATGTGNAAATGGVGGGGVGGGGVGGGGIGGGGAGGGLF